MTDDAVDTGPLESYLGDELGVAVTGTEVLSDGLNLILGVSTADDEYVVRRPNKLRDTALFVDLEREYGVLERLDDTAVPAPRPVLFCDDEAVLGDSFLVTTRLDGEPVPRGEYLPERFRDPSSRRTVAERLVDVLAAIHSLDAEPFAAVCERKTARRQVVDATERIDAAARVTGHEVTRLRAVGDWLLENAPSDSRTALVHGDFRAGNVLFAGADRPDLVGVLDWETAMLGDPLTELGYFLLDWRDENDPVLPLDDLEARHPDADAMTYVRQMNERGFAPFTGEPGSPGRRELVARYEDRTGIAFDRERFYRAHAAFMLGTVWLDLDRHQVAAGGSSDRAPYVEFAAKVADGIARGAFD